VLAWTRRSATATTAPRLSPRAARGKLALAAWPLALAGALVVLTVWVAGEVAARHERENVDTRLSAAPGFVDFVRSRAEGFGIRISIAQPESIDMPAFVGTVTLRYARPEPSPAAAVPSRLGNGG